MVEALAWSGLPIQRGDRIVESAAPGARAKPYWIGGWPSPASIQPTSIPASSAPKFTHIRKRGANVRRREFRDHRWLAADMNVAPSYTLETVEQIVTHPAVRIKGMLLTLKLPDWSLAAELPGWLARIRTGAIRKFRPGSWPTTARKSALPPGANPGVRTEPFAGF